MEEENWDPMALDYNDKRVNSYREGVGQDLQLRCMEEEGRYIHFFFFKLNFYVSG
jgi:hypothetical protein